MASCFPSEWIVRLKGAEDEGAVIADGERRALDLARRTANYCLGHRDDPSGLEFPPPLAPAAEL